jgi:hypothetical protein
LPYGVEGQASVKFRLFAAEGTMQSSPAGDPVPRNQQLRRSVRSRNAECDFALGGMTCHLSWRRRACRRA